MKIAYVVLLKNSFLLIKLIIAFSVASEHLQLVYTKVVVVFEGKFGLNLYIDEYFNLDMLKIVL